MSTQKSIHPNWVSHPPYVLWQNIGKFQILSEKLTLYVATLSHRVNSLLATLA